MKTKQRPGQVRDAIISVLSNRIEGAPLSAIETGVRNIIGQAGSSSIRSYLRLNTPALFRRNTRGVYCLRENPAIVYAKHDAQKTTKWASSLIDKATIYNADCIEWLHAQAPNSIHAVVTDPPYGLFEYSAEQLTKLRNGRGGVWRIPPSFDGAKRSPLPRFTVLSSQDLDNLGTFFFGWARALLPVLVPGANVIVASNPLLSYIVSSALAKAGLERRGEIARLVMTMRGGDRPKDAHEEFPDISVMPRSMWEPWLLFRKPLEGRVQDNLRKWKTGGFRRPSKEKPFGDIINSAPTNKAERKIAPHPSLKPQEFMRIMVRGVLPLGEGTILDPFAGSGSTLAAANVLGYESIGVERDRHYFNLATASIKGLSQYKIENYRH